MLKRISSKTTILVYLSILKKTTKNRNVSFGGDKNSVFFTIKKMQTQVLKCTFLQLTLYQQEYQIN